MTFCNMFFNYNFATGYALGNYLGNKLDNFLFGNRSGSCCCNGNSGWWGYTYYQSAPMFGVTNPFLNTYSFQSVQTFNFDFGNNWGTFDTYSFGNTAGTNFDYGGWNNTNNWNFSTPWSQPVNNTKKSTKPKREYANIDEDYNYSIGQKLADIAIENSSKRYDINRNYLGPKEPDEFTNLCGTYVSMAIEKAGLGEIRGDGYMFADKLRNSNKFKEISVEDVNWTDLPPGCILCYDKGSQKYSEDSGHVEITTGEKTAISDGTTHNIRKPDAIFIPV